MGEWLDPDGQIRDCQKLLCDWNGRTKSSLQTHSWTKGAPRLSAPGGFRSMPGYSGTPLVKKLGVKEDSRVALLSAPASFSASLGSLPEGATIASELGT